MTDTIDQQVIDDNKEIFATILAELKKAEFEILIATAWFTDDELFAALLEKIAQGVHIEVIVADNQENEKLDFQLLVAKGALVKKIKNVGYGIMNQKFCVIDKRIALHGSYNWTVNAKKNNHESIIITNHQETVESLIRNFSNIKKRIIEIEGGAVAQEVPERPKPTPIAMPQRVDIEFEKVLDAMIAAEVGSFDRKLLRGQGYERCQSNQGNHQVLYKAFDTVYSVFINDIDVIDDKKKRLIARIEEHRIRTNDLLNQTSRLNIEHLEREHQLTQLKLQGQRTSLGAEIEIANKAAEGINNEKIPDLEKKKAIVQDRIKSIELETLTPKIKWFELIPTSIFFLALLVYIFIFYSSAAYILLFSVADANEAKMAGSTIGTSVQVFNPLAVGKALHKGGTAPFFIFLFVFIPLAFAVIDAFVKERWKQIASIIFGVFILDVAVAFKVAEAVHEVNYLSGNTVEKWHGSLAFTDTNFYLVFVFGAFGLLLFKVVFKKLMEAFEDRNPDTIKQRNQFLITQLQQDISTYDVEVSKLKDEAASLQTQVIQLKAEDKHKENELAELPITLNRDVQHIKDMLSFDINTIEKTAAVYMVHVQSDNLPISVDALKDRINVFLEGWNDYLFGEYAVSRATTKSMEAFEIAMKWQQEKLQVTKVDKRVKFNTSE